MKRNIYLLGSIAILTILGVNIALSDSNGKLKNSGAPGENTCSQSGCHGAGNGNGITGVPDNMGPGSITLNCSNMPGWVYTPGTTYNMTVTITDPGLLVAGFSAVALNGGNGNAGTMVVTDATHTRHGSPLFSSNDYITHQGNTGSFASTNTNPAVFSFNWTAPSTNVGPIKFQFDGIAGNNNAKEDGGDNVYKGSQVLMPNATVSAPLVLSSVSNTTLRATTTAPGIPQSFYVGGLALTNNLTVTVPSPFEISLNQSSGFGTTAITLTPTSGVVATTQIFVRYNPTLSGSTSGSVAIASTGATGKTATLTGQSATPTIAAPSQSTIPTFTTTVGTPSIVDSFTVSFTGLIDSVLITSSPDFEISNKKLISYSHFDYGIPFPPVWAFTNLKVYVRYNPAVAGVHTGLVTIATSGATSKTVTVNGISTATGVKENMLTEQNVKLAPNPTRNNTALYFVLPEKENMNITMINISGQKIREIANRNFAQGQNILSIDCADVPEGLYFIVMQGERNKVVKKIVIQ